jgi:hypothetical protein
MPQKAKIEDKPRRGWTSHSPNQFAPYAVVQLRLDFVNHDKK